MTTSTTRYYRGYNLKQDPDSGDWLIYWGEYLDTKPTLEAAEAQVDEYKEGR